MGAVSLDSLWGTGALAQEQPASFDLEHHGDPVGAGDRRRAQAELAGLFRVGERKEDGPENVVSQEELDGIVRLYSEIRLGRTDLRFDTTGLSGKADDRYLEAIMGDLASILQSEDGRQLVRALAHNHNGNMTTLSPLFLENEDGEMDPSLGLDRTRGYASSATGDYDDAIVGVDGDANIGVDARVFVNPGIDIRPDGVDLAEDAWLPTRSDVFLYHELVHAMDYTLGTLDPTRADDTGDGADPFDAFADRREHRATGLGRFSAEEITENAYREARRAIGASNVGERSGDDGMAYRDTYHMHATTPQHAP